MNRQDLKDMIESLVIDLDPEHTFDHDKASWLIIDAEDNGRVTVYDYDDVAIFEAFARTEEEA